MSSASMHSFLGFRFIIYELSDDDIIDPQTSENLGRLEIVKGTGIVMHVLEKLSTIRSITTDNALNKRVIKSNQLLGAFGQTEEEIFGKDTLPFMNAKVGYHAKQVMAASRYRR
ncbi:MAG: hypothetical protein SCM11_00915 [Bacillota bacterium]|nr:hypothetical protein [Bacillota bacterium]